MYPKKEQCNEMMNQSTFWVLIYVRYCILTKCNDDGSDKQHDLLIERDKPPGILLILLIVKAKRPKKYSILSTKSS